MPFDENLNIMKPYDDILPWNEETSWDNFWTTFNSFENSTNFYNRAIFFIFQNMVDNMRQHEQERKLVRKFRFSAAEIITSTDSNKPSKTGEHKTDSNKNETEQIVADENDLEALQVIIQQVREKYGCDKYLSPKEKENRKARSYLNKQIDVYHTLQQSDSRKMKKPKPFHQYSYEECEKIEKTMLNTVANSENEGTDNVSANDKVLEFNEQKKITLQPFQQEVVDTLKQIMRNSTGAVDVKPGQLLAFMQGIPGAGKTTTAKKLAEKMGLKTLFSGTTGTAAAQLKTDTINTLLGLGLNLADFTSTELSPTVKQKIMITFENVQLLVIDEVSMLTPVTLTKISTYLRLALESEYLFGGISVLLIGDFFQFPPIQRNLKNPALYQAAVMLGMGLKMPNDAYRVGAEIFTKFRKVTLDGQMRASKEFNEWLAQLRNLEVEYPVTDEWLAKLTSLSSEDFQNEKIDWNDTTIVVSGNAERYKFITEKIKSFGAKRQQPILRWICPLKVARRQYQLPEFDPEDVYPQLVKHFVRGAKCVLTESLETKIGLGKGSDAVYLDVVWENEEEAVDLDTLPIGEVTTVTQPDYIVIRIETKTDFRVMAIKPTRATFEDANKKNRSYLAHETELSAAVTFHKMQGKTVEATILSLNSTSSVSKKICAVTLPSLYVGCSRVHDHDHLRVLPLSEKDKQYLKTLKWHPYLRKFFNNYDNSGRWIPNGLREERNSFVKNVKLKLGMTQLTDLTVAELKEFAKDLDIIISSKPQ